MSAANRMASPGPYGSNPHKTVAGFSRFATARYRPRSDTGIVTGMIQGPTLVIAITERNAAWLVSWNVPRLVEDGTGEVMSLGAMAVTGFVAAVVVIVGAVMLINKFAHGE
jgi:hypothetical protein